MWVPLGMRSLRTSRLGLSEIVGTLMLVLIVVVAATAFSAFVLTYQKQLQAQQSVSQQRNLESIKILSVASTLNTTPSAAGGLWQLNFLIASLSVNPSKITGITIDGNPVECYNATVFDEANGSFRPPLSLCGPNSTLLVPARERLNMVLNVSHGSLSSFYDHSINMRSNQFIRLDVLTILENDFTRTFIPPSAVYSIVPFQVWTGSTFQAELQFDGSGSIQPGNDSIVSWVWAITPHLGGSTTTQTGERVVPFFSALAPSSTVYDVVFTVTNSAGLVGSASFSDSW